MLIWPKARSLRTGYKSKATGRRSIRADRQCEEASRRPRAAAMLTAIKVARVARLTAVQRI